MKKLLLIFLGLVCLQAFSQSDNCSSATAITANASCIYTNGTSAGATQSIPGCVGTADDDVWYEFTATQTSQQITVTPSAGYDPVVQLFSGACSVLANLYCQDLTNMGQPEVINATGLTVGTVYRFRVYHYFTGSGSSTFSVCVSNPPTPPVNDACASATALSVNASCVTTNGTSYGATQSYTTVCNGSPDDDVWYTFTANNSQQVITVNPSANMDAVVEVLSGTCGSFTSIDCIDNSGTGGTETATEVGLTAGTTYYVRVYDYWSGNGGYPFTICITGAAGTGDEPCNAFVLPPVTANCGFFTMSNASATASTATAPTPANCGGSAPHIGGFSSSSHDMWFAVTVPASGNIYITSEPNIGTGAITDGVMALYSGTCGSLTQISCDDDYAAYPGTANDYLPYLTATGLTPGTTVYIRYWGYGSNTGTFGLCVTSPTNDACANALYICDLNGYSSSTSAAYTPDRPCNMRGDHEDASGNVIATAGAGVADGSYPAGIFGLGGTWGTGESAGAYDVQIDNNSWIKYTAAATSATFSIAVGNCWVGNYPSGGLQMQIFSGTNCCNFAPVSDFKEGSSGFVVTANSLTVGQDYYLMVDGYAGDICNYTVTVNSGVLFPAITAAPSSICYGDSTKLTGPPGASAYAWSPGGQTTQVITVAPPTNMTYSCVVSGVCGNKQTLSKAITVNPLPVTLINGALTQTLNICANTTTTLTGSGASTYSWSPATGLSASSGSVVTVTPTSTTNITYTVTGTSASGCKSIATVSIKGLALPTFSVSSNHPSTCFNQKDTLIIVPSPAGTYTYSWSNGANTASITPTVTSNTVLTAVLTNTNNCTSTVSSTITVLSLPTISSTSAFICNGQTATLTGSGGISYTWTPATALSSGGISTSSVTANPMATANYTITGTGANGCLATNTTTVTVNPLPVVSVNSATVCNGANVTLTAAGATTYSWNTSQTGQSISVSPSTTTSYTVTGTNGNNCTGKAVATISVNPVPTINTQPTISPSNCGASTGAITGIGITGVGSLSYTWTNASNQVVSTSQNINNQPAGTYHVFVTDANCSATFGPYSITNPGAPAAPGITTNTTTACVGQSIHVSAASGASSPSFNWSGPNSFTTTSSSFTLNPTTANESGVYAVTVTSAGCTGPAATVTLTINPLPLVNATSSSSGYCAGSTVVLNGSSAASYTWTAAGGYSSNQQNPQIANSTTLTSGIYTLTATDANGCVNTDTAKVTVNLTPIITSYSTNASNNILCAGQTLILNASTNPSTATLTWSGPNNYLSPPQSTTLTNAGTLQSGTYSVTASVGVCSSTTNTLVVIVNPTPAATASVSGSNAVCSGNTVIFNGGSSGNAYNWSGPAGANLSAQQNYTLTNVPTSASGNYTLTVTNSYSCVATAVTSLTVNLTPSITSFSTNAVNNTLCAGQTLILNASTNPSTATLTWSGPDNYLSPPQSTVIPNVGTLQSGTYSVTASLGTCVSAANTIPVIVNPVPVAVAAVSSNTVCSGNTVVLTGGASGNQYSWNGPSGYTSTNQTNTLTPTNGGTYTLTVTNNFNCTAVATTSFTVNATPAPAVTANVQTCTGGTLTLTATGNGTINWYSDAGLTNLVYTGTNYNPQVPSGSTGIYYVSVTSANNCPSATSTSVSVGNYNLQVGASANTYNGNAPLTVAFSGTVTGSSNPTYSWTLGDNATSSSQTPSHTYNNGGDYVVVLTAIDPASTCIDTAMLTIHVIDEMIVIIPNIFSPNGDNINDEFFLTTHGVKTIEGFIMNRWGQMMFTWNDLNSAWDGKAPNGNNETDGVYFYVIKATPFKGEMKEYKGPLTLVR